jgi:hypothetical protein
MARGWESKDVESQQELKAEERRLRAKGEQSPEELERERRLEDLRLNRTRVLRDLSMAANPRYRRMLEESYRFLEEEIRKLRPQ